MGPPPSWDGVGVWVASKYSRGTKVNTRDISGPTGCDRTAGRGGLWTARPARRAVLLGSAGHESLLRRRARRGLRPRLRVVRHRGDPARATPRVAAAPRLALPLLRGADRLAGQPAAARLAPAAGALLFFYLLFLVYPAGMGFGDVKFAPTLGMALGWLSWPVLAVGFFLAFLLGGVVGIVALAVLRMGRKAAIPFGPWMAAGALLGVLVGTQIANWYLSGLTGA